MTRAIAVIVVAGLCAAMFGVDESAWAAQDDAARQAARQQQAISTRVSKIDVGSVVKVERNDGRKIEGVLTAKTPDSITLNVYQRRPFRRPRLVSTDTISLGEIREIKKPLTRTQITLITTGIAVGSCAAIVLVATSSLDSKSPQAILSIEDKPAPATSGAPEPSDTEQGSSSNTP
jgi:hypothetical protein